MFGSYNYLCSLSLLSSETVWFKMNALFMLSRVVNANRDSSSSAMQPIALFELIFDLCSVQFVPDCRDLIYYLFLSLSDIFTPSPNPTLFEATTFSWILFYTLWENVATNCLCWNARVRLWQQPLRQRRIPEVFSPLDSFLTKFGPLPIWALAHIGQGHPGRHLGAKCFIFIVNSPGL